MDAHKPLLLLVEDSPDARLLIQHAIEGAGLDIRVDGATNGQEAINYLEGNGNYANRERYPLPTLIVTDIQMPVLSGLELLTWIKGQTELTAIPVVGHSHPNNLKAIAFPQSCRKMRSTNT